MQNNNNLTGTMCTVKVTVSPGAGSGEYDTDVAAAGIINGKFVVALASKNDVALPTTDANTGLAFIAQAGGADSGRTVGTICAYVIGQTLAGAIQVAQGSIENLADIADTVFIRPDFPGLPDDFMPFTYLIVKVGNTGSAFTIGTSDITGTDITDTYVSISMLPDRPQVS